MLSRQARSSDHDSPRTATLNFPLVSCEHRVAHGMRQRDPMVLCKSWKQYAQRDLVQRFMEPTREHQCLRCTQHGGVLEILEELRGRDGKKKQSMVIGHRTMSHQGLRSHDAEMWRIPATMTSPAGSFCKLPICKQACSEFDASSSFSSSPISRLRSGQP